MSTRMLLGFRNGSIEAVESRRPFPPSLLPKGGCAQIKIRGWSPPLNAERLMTPTAVLIAVGGFCRTHHSGGFFFCLESFVPSSPAFPEPFSAISAAHRNGRRWEKSSLPDHDALGRRVAHGYLYRTRSRFRVDRPISRRPSGGRSHNFRTYGSQFDLCRSSCDDRLGCQFIAVRRGRAVAMNVLPAKYSATETDLASFSTGFDRLSRWFRRHCAWGSGAALRLIDAARPRRGDRALRLYGDQQ